MSLLFGTMTPMRFERPTTSARATWSGSYFSFVINFRTRSLVAFEIRGWSRRASEIVVLDSPRRFPISCSVIFVVKQLPFQEKPYFSALGGGRWESAAPDAKFPVGKKQSAAYDKKCY